MSGEEQLPFILIDTREPKPHPWEPYLSVSIIRGTLETGDFSLPGCENMVAVERKTLDDLIACFKQENRKRFEQELRRSTRVKTFLVVVEATLADLCSGAYRSMLTPQAALGSVVALQMRYGCPFIFAGDQQLAAIYTQSLLMRWYRDHVKALDEVRRATRRLEKIQHQLRGNDDSLREEDL